jgi:serine/threonine-protein kinase
VLFHLLTGRPPFDLEGVGTIIAAHMREPPPVPSEIAPGVPAVLDPLVARCLAKRPDDRFTSMLELQQACDASLGLLPAAPPTVPDVAVAHAVAREDNPTTLGHSVGQSIETHPMRRGVWVAVAAVAVVAGIVLAVMTTRRASNDQDPVPAAAPAAAMHAPPPPTITPIDPPAPPPAQSEVAPPPAKSEVAPAPVPPPRTKVLTKKRKRTSDDLYEDRN